MVRYGPGLVVLAGLLPAPSVPEAALSQLVQRVVAAPSPGGAAVLVCGAGLPVPADDAPPKTAVPGLSAHAGSVMGWTLHWQLRARHLVVTTALVWGPLLPKLVEKKMMDWKRLHVNHTQ